MLEFQAGCMPRLEHLELDIQTSDSTLCGCYVSGVEHLNTLTMVRVNICKEPHLDGVGNRCGVCYYECSQQASKQSHAQY